MCPSSSEVSSSAKKSIALVGSPNCGKTTLYNWLTGSRFKTVNYPGATVEYSLGHLSAHWNSDMMVMDTPGTYSLHPKSADEVVTLKSLYHNPQLGVVSGVIIVVDGTQMNRHLLLAQQLQETGFPMIIVVTMADLLRKQGIEIDFAYLEKTFKCPVLAFDGLLAGGLQEIIAAMKQVPTGACSRKPMIWDFKTQENKLKECEQIAKAALSHKTQDHEKKLSKIGETTERIDRVLLHPFWGLISFIVIMGGLFSSIFWMAQPFMDLIDKGFSELNHHVLAINPDSLVIQFLANGVISSFSAVLVFVPQVLILFFGISLLEGTGYLARAATLIDRPFSAVGMSGRSFVPILSGYACAVPAIIATRNISSARDRWITSFVIPLLTCSARLPVYALLLGFLFRGHPAWHAGLILAVLYLGSLLLGGFAAGILHRILPKRDASFFMMELPIYRRPKFRVLFHHAMTRTYSYIKKAGVPIFTFAVLIWVGTHFPNYKTANEHDQLEQSYAGQLGKAIEPVVHPMGIDWRVGVGLISAFAAREVFVSSLAVVFNITDKDEETQQQSLLTQMQNATNSRGEKVFTVSSVIGIIVFFMIALQCMATVAVQLRESGSWKFAMTQLVVFNVVGYIAAVLIVQALRLVSVA